MSFLGIILYPFTLLYDLATRFRNHLFNIGYKKSFEFDRAVIAVGNLSVGGTGKTPMVEYLIKLLNTSHTITTLSRGYGRKTKGFKIATDEDDHTTIGDEPKQFQNKFSDITVAVGEERAVAIPFILAEKPDTDLIILDDAYQHRYVKPNFNILLTPFNKPFYEDFVLPSGRLRESRNGATRADAIIITKCPDHISDDNMTFMKNKVSQYSKAPVYFTYTSYQNPEHVFYPANTDWNDNVILFSGIASSYHLRNYLIDEFNLLEEIQFRDHHDYSTKDIKKIVEVFNSLSHSKKCIVTTEKDMVRLQKPEFRELLENIPVFYIPIEVRFVKDGKNFDEQLLKSVKTQSH